ncbi:MAG: CD3324 family protein [Clostridiaceae bacterium]
MKYVNAQKVLPEEVIEIIQEYIDGEFLYIPRKNGNEKSWGEKSGARETLSERNKIIFGDHKAGASVPELSQKYFLSEQSIRRIVNLEKKLLSKTVQNDL